MADIEASAKAVEETAKTAGKAIDAASGLGRFVARIIGGALEEAGGMLTDNVRFRRAVRALRLEKRFEEIRAEMSIDAAVKPLNMNIALPLIEAASLQEDDELQDMFAHLLVNGTNPDSGTQVQRSYVSILQDLTPLSAKLLDMLCKVPHDPNPEKNVVHTAGLPDRYISDTARR